MSEESKKKPRGHRRKQNPPLTRKHVYITDEQAALLRKWGRGDVSAGLRWLIDAAALIILRKSDLDAALDNKSGTDLDNQSSA